MSNPNVPFNIVGGNWSSSSSDSSILSSPPGSDVPNATATAPSILGQDSNNQNTHGVTPSLFERFGAQNPMPPRVQSLADYFAQNGQNPTTSNTQAPQTSTTSQIAASNPSIPGLQNYTVPGVINGFGQSAHAPGTLNPGSSNSLTPNMPILPSIGTSNPLAFTPSASTQYTPSRSNVFGNTDRNKMKQNMRVQLQASTNAQLNNVPTAQLANFNTSHGQMSEVQIMLEKQISEGMDKMGAIDGFAKEPTTFIPQCVDAILHFKGQVREAVLMLSRQNVNLDDHNYVRDSALKIVDLQRAVSSENIRNTVSNEIIQQMKDVCKSTGFQCSEVEFIPKLFRAAESLKQERDSAIVLKDAQAKRLDSLQGGTINQQNASASQSARILQLESANKVLQDAAVQQSQHVTALKKMVSTKDVEISKLNASLEIHKIQERKMEATMQTLNKNVEHHKDQAKRSGDSYEELTKSSSKARLRIEKLKESEKTLRNQLKQQYKAGAVHDTSDRPYEEELAKAIAATDSKKCFTSPIDYISASAQKILDQNFKLYNQWEDLEEAKLRLREYKADEEKAVALIIAHDLPASKDYILKSAKLINNLTSASEVLKEQVVVATSERVEELKKTLETRDAQIRNIHRPFKAATRQAKNEMGVAMMLNPVRGGNLMLEGRTATRPCGECIVLEKMDEFRHVKEAEREARRRQLDAMIMADSTKPPGMWVDSEEEEDDKEEEEEEEQERKFLLIKNRQRSKMAPAANSSFKRKRAGDEDSAPEVDSSTKCVKSSDASSVPVQPTNRDLSLSDASINPLGAAKSGARSGFFVKISRGGWSLPRWFRRRG
ncbi:uncharacterized protein RSE6_12175 [Rhynchosporium secalis]|uniref:Uncharacterized protein n=1 Tax=Rhynchosporium secalis TaxID=38038 RepID=A0A1E1MPU5_RHYSE|nr:uncharacterized protein RSE6_12175 [Rhynchosporium secalis]